jgi:hypothetical protein
MRYLLITYYKKPNGQIDESTAVSRNLKKRDIQTCNVILDFHTLSVVKCSMVGTVVPRDWDRIVGYYYPFYTSIMERLFQENGHKLPDNETAKSTQDL